VRRIYALYSSADAAQRAVNNLRKAGIPDDVIAICSSVPLEEYEFGQRDRATWMPWIAGGGAAAGLTTGYLLTTLTQNAWPIITGGMPIVSNWTNIIILFELTMLGAVLATVITLMIAAKLPNRRPELYDPEVAGGKILIGVSSSREGDSVERALRAAGPGSLKILP
jgi:ActD protein